MFIFHIIQDFEECKIYQDGSSFEDLCISKLIPSCQYYIEDLFFEQNGNIMSGKKEVKNNRNSKKESYNSKSLKKFIERMPSEGSFRWLQDPQMNRLDWKLRELQFQHSEVD